MTELSCPIMIDTIISRPLALFKRAATIMPNRMDSTILAPVTNIRATAPSSLRSTENTIAI